MRAFFFFFMYVWESNPPSWHCKSHALPTELQRTTYLALSIQSDLSQPHAIHSSLTQKMLRTVYRVAYRQVTRAVPVSHSYPECCPGWRRLHSHNCNQAVCGQSCVNGGTCLIPNHCACPLGWMGRHCQTDVDECREQQPCSHQCVNMAGSYHCVCREGYRLAGDTHSCENLPPPPPASSTHPSQEAANDHIPPSSDTGGGFGLTENVTEEVQSLKNRVELLEQKLQLVLAPFTSLFPMSLDEGVSEKTSFLSHSFQQLDRIDSLSEQVGFLEERLGTCSCQEN
ncbi:epidermal growth factor-like protein 7 isoform X3 [Salmo trutta]|uniref:epidermal growth factor-like protein 7 isoform X3 n=1 Tax=Salmo trutta TaxID=8032 RepID=UPI00113110D3|nr:epidermal growth factor-like protein 7 isoform X3 [Salmo trutta]